jgi:hypothetical protein
MTSPAPQRLALCQQAYKLYGTIDGPIKLRGQAQCLLSIAQTIGNNQFQGRSLRAFDFAYPLNNPWVSRECVDEMKKSLNYPSAYAQTTLEIRDRLWAWADSAGGLEKVDALRLCLAVDAKFRPSRVGEDLEKLICDEPGQFDRLEQAKLAGYVYAEGRRTRRTVGNRVPNMGKGLPVRVRGFSEGQKLSIKEAVLLARAPRIGSETTPEH